MFGLAAGQTVTVIGLAVGLLGVALLAMPLIGRLGQYRFAKEIARENKKSGANKIASYLDEKAGFTPESQIRDIRLSFAGAVFVATGFVLQIVGVFLSH